MSTISTDPLRVAKEFAANACLDWGPEDGSLSVFHPDGAARVSPDGQVMSLPNPRLKAALERKIAESEKEVHSNMNDAEEIFSHISEDLLPHLTDRQLTNLIELIRTVQVEREEERIISSVGA